MNLCFQNVSLGRFSNACVCKRESMFFTLFHVCIFIAQARGDLSMCGCVCVHLFMCCICNRHSNCGLSRVSFCFNEFRLLIKREKKRFADTTLLLFCCENCPKHYVLGYWKKWSMRTMHVNSSSNVSKLQRCIGMNSKFQKPKTYHTDFLLCISVVRASIRSFSAFLPCDLHWYRAWTSENLY